ncbi:3'-5' RNA helicase YTHDC2-like [Tigriopus californicus]|uniref:3'-5' RNA helicase YTHDC2-like n=1 Tax=Tigriopus californicus TaxID=6832 RepID=UPI0027DA7BF7|nr:3'-5' RNA helicase YTHDC2-like [Tigriopus californicus]XP_059081226.1 3'-5' RNA helicase YTHDC2-like [Tigriopus californicus]XP_059081227.1 3'-5' RNA helicase YTHDC2-like [Tigriopus californicus]
MSPPVEPSDPPPPAAVGPWRSKRAMKARSKGPKWPALKNVGQELRLASQLRLRDFQANPEDMELEFPSSLTSEERSYIHRLALSMGLKSKSRGNGAKRFLTVFKHTGSTIVRSDATLKMSARALTSVHTFLRQNPATPKEKEDYQPPTDRDHRAHSAGAGETGGREISRMTGRLLGGAPNVPPPSSCSREVLQIRQQLPIWSRQSEILQAIASHQVTLVCGHTGSGKTTQVPQFILEQSAEEGLPCRMACTQPRRISAVSMAERVAFERNEKVGQTVGYQIKLESRISPKTLLTFCTCGVLLRTLMGNPAALASYTHIIVDEVHERERLGDFLLTVLREGLTRHKNLKLIIMSATMDEHIFTSYFAMPSSIIVPGRLFPVQEFFLESVLTLLDSDKQNAKRKQTIEVHSQDQDLSLNALQIANPEDQNVPNLKPVLSADDTAALDEALLNGFRSDAALQVLQDLVLDTNGFIDYQHSVTGVTPLMCASVHGDIDFMEQLLTSGCDVDVKAKNSWTALDFAKSQNQKAAVDTLTSCSGDVMSSLISKNRDDWMSLPENQRQSLEAYNRTRPQHEVDFNLAAQLIAHLHETENVTGAILVFLPGLHDIMTLRNFLSPLDGLQIVMLHSRLVGLDQRAVFKPPPRGLRKVILATNIAEASITVEDVTVVIDSGKVNEISFDPLAGTTMLKTVWISKSSAKQRQGRAGRCQSGNVYRLYSSLEFQTFAEHTVPEILRTPLTELCLYTKLVTCPNTSIADFLSRAPQAPSFFSIRNAIQTLKSLEALDAWEDVTVLGSHLLDLPVDPKFGKMILFGVIMKCLDPVLTLAASLGGRDPFVIPNDPDKRAMVKARRRRFVGEAYSDHLVLLRVFQEWEKARSDGRERAFCVQESVSGPAMEMILGTRSRLLAQLRASGFIRSKPPHDMKDLNKHSDNWPLVKAALTVGCYPSLARHDRETGLLRSAKESTLRLNPDCSFFAAKGKGSSNSTKSSIKSIPTDWFIFEEMSRLGRMALIRGVTAISPVTVLLFAGPSRRPSCHLDPEGAAGRSRKDESSDSESETYQDGANVSIQLDDWITFRCEPSLAQIVWDLKTKWCSLLMRRLQHPDRPASPADNSFIDCVAGLLRAEDQCAKFVQPSGIGQKPIFV